MSYKITTFYKFVELSPEKVQEVEQLLHALAEEHNVLGLVILGKEGVNSTLGSTPPELEAFKKDLLSKPEFKDLQFKDSPAEKLPFKRFKTKVRSEIVTLYRNEYFPNTENNHLTPSEWNQALAEDDCVVIDTRNDYEVAIGKFKDAIDPGLKMFSEFPEYVKNSGIPKDKKVLMYCTGGIRCEKAIYEMQSQGYEQVYQLEGGILKYLEEFPDQNFEGECFVFDHRVAVDQNLKPSTTYHLCPHCGDPGDLVTTCQNCGQAAKICTDCQEIPHYQSCSKNCSHHLERQIQA